VHLSDERVIVILLVLGVAAGYLSGRFARGSGSGLVGDAAVGIVGALIANWLLPRFGVHLFGGIARLVIESAIGATTLLLIIGLVGAKQRFVVWPTEGTWVRLLGRRRLGG
jgi:uncharacterized membrane protein YeaQ/YmgE (transglycosylase-associated protein family)